MWRRDLEGVLRGLRKVGECVVKEEQQRVDTMWKHSSLKKAAEAVVDCSKSAVKGDVVSGAGLQRTLETVAYKSSSLQAGVRTAASMFMDRSRDHSTQGGNPHGHKTSTQHDTAAKIPVKTQTQPLSSSSPSNNSMEDEKRFDKHVRQIKLDTQTLSEYSRETRVPASRVSRIANFGGLALGLGAGAIAEVSRQAFGLSEPEGSGLLGNNPFLSKANTEKMVRTLCRVRGAALKIGQMLSIQDNSLINPQFQAIFEQVRQNADFMPQSQMESVIVRELGENWKDKFKRFDMKPIAAASIGQVHYGILQDNREVAVKIQYPGVADSIVSDIDNVLFMLKYTNILPKGLYAENVMATASKELAWEVDYKREAKMSARFRLALQDDSAFYVPENFPELSSKQVLTNEFVHGVAVDRVGHLSQEVRDWICYNIMRLTLIEIFQHNIMQTDPNWANFFFLPKEKQIALLDFGAARTFDKVKFTDKYIQIIRGAALQDRDLVLKKSLELGFLTGYETSEMTDAHVSSVMILGEPFIASGKFDFAKQTTTTRIHNLIRVMLQHRLAPPPEESYSLHRKMSGVFLLCSKLGAKIDCKQVFEETYANYSFESKSESHVY